MQDRNPLPGREPMRRALQAAHRMNADIIGSDHILLGLLEEREGPVARAWMMFSVDPAAAAKEVERLIAPPVRKPWVTPRQLPFSPAVRGLIEKAAETAKRLGHERIEPRHILAGLLANRDCVGTQALINLGVDTEKLASHLGLESRMP